MAKTIAMYAAASASHGVLHRHELTDLSYSPAQIQHLMRKGEIRAVLPRVYLIGGAPWTWQAKLVAASKWCGGVASHTSAAILLGILEWDKEPIEISTTKTRRTKDGMVIHRVSYLPSDCIITVNGVKCTDAERTVLDLGTIFHRRRLGIAIDTAVRKDLLSLQGLAERCLLESRQGRDGLQKTRDELSIRNPALSVPKSSLELRLFEALEHPSMPRFHRHYMYDTERGFSYEIDAYRPEADFGVEANHYGTHSGTEMMDKDAEKLGFFQERGVLILPATPASLKNLDAFRARVRNIIAQREK